MTWKEDIEALVCKWFSEEWFLKVRNRFENNSFYDQERDSIQNPKPYSFPEVDFFHYSWYGMEDGIGEPDRKNDEDWDLIPRFHIGKELEQTIRFHFQAGDVERSCKLVDASIDYMHEVIDDLKFKTQIEVYQQLLEKTSVELEKWIRARTKDVFALSELSFENKDKLEFYLLQDQLAALLYLLMESGILSSGFEDRKMESYLFFERYFLCHKKSLSSPRSPIQNVHKKISEARRGETLDSLDLVFERLQKAYNKVRELKMKT